MESTPLPVFGGMMYLRMFAIAFLMGGLGSLAMLSVVANSSDAQRILGGSGANGPITRTEKIIVEENSAFIDVVKKVSPSVVSILTTRNVRDFFGNVVEQKGGGTGFIITSDGLILTNKHVVSDKDAEYTIVTSDGKDYTAKVLATDPVADIAVIKIEATGLPVVELGNSNDLEIGQWVVAIGNALAEFQNTVTVGVVSAKDRQITASDSAGASERLEGLIQTDAAINPGNSGGPLVNLKGQVIGINTATSTDAQNIGFAIPINVAKSDIDSVKRTGKIVRPFLGVRYLPITKEIARLENLPVDHGALVIRGTNEIQLPVLPGSPADKAGLAEGDIILSMNNEDVTEKSSLASLMQQYKPGDVVTLKVLRKGEQTELKVTLGELK